MLAKERESSIWQESGRETIEFKVLGVPYQRAGKYAIAGSHGFEVAIVLCLLADVIGALKEGETGMRCGPSGPIPQLPPQL
jgi:hypothetical protein